MKSTIYTLNLLLAFLFGACAYAQTVNVCQGDSLRLSTTALNIPAASGVEWYRNNTLISTDTAFVITQPGVYTLRCTGTGACSSDFSQPLTVNVNTLKAGNDSASTLSGQPVVIRVLLNDTAGCYPMVPPSIVVTQQGSHGHASYAGSGNISYTPTPCSCFCGVDTFYYVVYDNHGNASNTAMVTVSVCQIATPLPITLANFNAVKSGDASHLTWTTYSTKNASHFEVERSADGKNFEFKGKVAMPANSTNVVDYSYWDKNPLTGKNFYRLKMVDLSGTATYSDIRMVDFDATNPIKIYPIPANDYITADVGAALDHINGLVVIDISGKEVLRKNITATITTIDLQGFTSGTYYVRFFDKNNNLTDGSYKFNKVK